MVADENGRMLDTILLVAEVDRKSSAYPPNDAFDHLRPSTRLPETAETRPGSCWNRPRRCCGSGLATGEDILLDDRVDAPISVNHLGDAEVDANRN